METPVDKQGGPPAAIPAPLQDLHAERSLVVSSIEFDVGSPPGL